jgi:hypothetical protein
MIEGEGDAFRFHQTQDFNGKPNEDVSLNKKLPMHQLKVLKDRCVTRNTFPSMHKSEGDTS